MLFYNVRRKLQCAVVYPKPSVEVHGEKLKITVRHQNTARSQGYVSQVTDVQDLGVPIDTTFTSSIHCTEGANAVRRSLFMIRKSSCHFSPAQRVRLQINAWANPSSTIELRLSWNTRPYNLCLQSRYHLCLSFKKNGWTVNGPNSSLQLECYFCSSLPTFFSMPFTFP